MFRPYSPSLPLEGGSVTLALTANEPNDTSSIEACENGMLMWELVAYLKIILYCILNYHYFYSLYIIYIEYIISIIFNTLLSSHKAYRGQLWKGKQNKKIWRNNGKRADYNYFQRQLKQKVLTKVIKMPS